MEEKQALILFSGGLDSLLTSCKMIENGYQVTLVHYDNGSSSGLLFTVDFVKKVKF